MTQPSMKRAANSRAWALGEQRRNGFHVRKIVWGRLMARMEKREGEHIQPVIIMLYDGNWTRQCRLLEHGKAPMGGPKTSGTTSR